MSDLHIKEQGGNEDNGQGGYGRLRGGNNSGRGACNASLDLTAIFDSEVLMTMKMCQQRVINTTNVFRTSC